MKNKVLYLSFIVLALFTSCADSFLDREPQGGVLTENQYQQLSNTLEGSMRGLYAQMYTYSAHDEFGQRSIDLFTDITSGDIALTAQNYGWFLSDERLQSYQVRTGYTWLYYYNIIHNANKILKAFDAQTTLKQDVVTYGFPTNGLYVISGGDTLHTYTETDAGMASVLAQTLSMRAYAYSHMIQLYGPTPSVMRVNQLYDSEESGALIPLYTEENMDVPQSPTTMSKIYDRIESDLKTAIDYFEGFAANINRSGKLAIDVNVSRGLLAYALLNKAANIYRPDRQAPIYKEAIKYATDVINTGIYSVLPNKELTTTGFNNININCWMWAQDVTTETATGLGSFFGQVDIHSYSYAYAGDTKVIDKNLREQIPTWDGRSGWFNDGKANSKFLDCPDGKFYSANNPTSTKDNELDREWLSDNVFMRVELMYLIAAEASYMTSDDAGAISYLRGITDNRMNLNNVNAATEYADYLATLSTRSNLLEAIMYNWRVELWGEGYGLQTFRRLDTPNKRKRGGNHLENPGKEVDNTDVAYTFQIPGSETTYNPNFN